jgi:hypothetical protein
MNAVLRLRQTSMAQISIAQNYLTHGRPSLGLVQCDYTAGYSNRPFESAQPRHHPIGMR